MIAKAPHAAATEALTKAVGKLRGAHAAAARLKTDIDAGEVSEEKLAAEIAGLRGSVDLADVATLNVINAKTLAHELGGERTDALREKFPPTVEQLRGELARFMEVRSAFLAPFVQPLTDSIAEKFAAELGSQAALNSARESKPVVQLRGMIGGPGPFALFERPVDAATELLIEAELLISGATPWLSDSPPAAVSKVARVRPAAPPALHATSS